jgi:hypothetical protein
MITIINSLNSELSKDISPDLPTPKRNDSDENNPVIIVNEIHVPSVGLKFSKVAK